MLEESRQRRGYFRQQRPQDRVHLSAIEAGLNVLADKPMVIRPPIPKLKHKHSLWPQAKGRLLYDIMTERFEITSILQRELVAANGTCSATLLQGTPEDPAITKESVHHFSKIVAGRR